MRDVRENLSQSKNQDPGPPFGIARESLSVPALTLIVMGLQEKLRKVVKTGMKEEGARTERIDPAVVLTIDPNCQVMWRPSCVIFRTFSSMTYHFNSCRMNKPAQQRWN